MNENYLEMPSAFNVQEAPELAALGILNAALHTAINTLAAAHPAMCDPDDPAHPYAPLTPLSTAARRIINCAVTLRSRLIRYSTLLAEGQHGELFLWEEFPWNCEAMRRSLVEPTTLPIWSNCETPLADQEPPVQAPAGDGRSPPSPPGQP